MKSNRIFSNIAVVILTAALALASASCDKDRNGNDSDITKGAASYASMDVTVSPLEQLKEESVKAATKSAITNVYGSDDDDFRIIESVSDMDDSMMEAATKGWEVTTGNIATKYGAFALDAWAMLPESAGSSTLVPSQYISQNVEYGSGKWNWSESAPLWMINTPLSIWSYAPVGSVSPSINTSKYVGDAFNELNTFTHTVPKAETAQKDILFAYNVETRQFKKNGSAYVKPFELEDGQSEQFKVKFYHALAAVKFKLDVTDADTRGGADIHSITLCYIDPATKEIVTSNAGIATTGDCTVTGSGTGTGSVSFNWDNQGTRKPLHYEYADLNTSDPDYVATKTVKGGYVQNDEGVLFMVPQSFENISIIVEFSKYGGKKYYTKVKPISDNEWEAGKVYTYTLQIGEFHVPGELMDIGTRQLWIEELKNASYASGMSAFSKTPKIKGVTAVGLMLADYACSAETGHYVYLIAAKNGIDPYPGKTGDQIRTGLGNGTISYDTWTDIDFTYVDNRLTKISKYDPSKYSSAVDSIDYTKIYEFGLAPDEPETYHSLSQDFVNTGATNKSVGTLSNGFINHIIPTGQSTPKHTGPFYYACRIPENADDNPNNDVTTINYFLKSSAGSNNTGFLSYVLGFMVLEVAPDPNFPGNFNDIDWSTL